MSDTEGRLFIGGRWVEPSSTEWLVSINPASEQESGRCPLRTLRTSTAP
jgi:aldehyde dehydrogenase (NAD+)